MNTWSQISGNPFVTITLPIVITVALAVFTQNRSFDLLGKRIDDIRDALRAEMAKNHSELLAKLADVENRLDRRIERLEQARWKP